VLTIYPLTRSEQKRRELKRKRELEDLDGGKSEEIDSTPRSHTNVSREDARKNRLKAALWASKHDWDEFGNPVDAFTARPKEFIAEIQGNTSLGKTFFWPKLENI
jgi:hypothetical protein